MRTIWVLSGGPSTEYEVSLSSGRVVCENMNLVGRQVRPVIILRDGTWAISSDILTDDTSRGWLDEFFGLGMVGELESVSIDGALTALLTENPECAVLALHGQFGEDGSLQGFLDTAGVPYTASRVLASSVAFNKSFAIALYRMAGLRTPRGIRLLKDSYTADECNTMQTPVFVKPVHGGSSVGMTLVHDSADIPAAVEKALAFDTEALVEERVNGVEVSCGVLDLIKGGKIVSTAMPPTEIRPLECEFFDYEAKYTKGKSLDITPAELPKEVIERVQECALEAHRILCCEGMSRTDMIIPSGPDSEPVLLETNTIPGMTPTSLLPQQCAHIGMDFPSFIDALIEHAIFRAHQFQDVAARQRTKE